MPRSVVRTHGTAVDNDARCRPRTGEVHCDLRSEAAAPQERPWRRFSLTLAGESAEQCLLDPVAVAGRTDGGPRPTLEDGWHGNVRDVRTELERATGADYVERPAGNNDDRQCERSIVTSPSDTRFEP